MKRARLWLVLSAVIIIAPFVFLKAADSLLWWKSTDYSRQPRAQVFQKVFGRTPPPGINNLRISGHSYFIKHWVWMRIQANNAGINNLVANAEPSDDCLRYPDQSAFNKFNAADKNAVNWQQIQGIKNPECYQWHSQSNRKPIAWWFGVMIVDRKNGLVFVHGSME